MGLCSEVHFLAASPHYRAFFLWWYTHQLITFIISARSLGGLQSSGTGRVRSDPNEPAQREEKPPCVFLQTRGRSDHACTISHL